ncbi:OmpA family protein [Pedobacter changchengzhani]|uniref:OmpA family protein n=1 Tax=Pedobacter changchengzhani TaxID=2529274 RepID=A0A4R5MMZ0_9SPHI|nr:OmpA family protein [Pedobacter changchengzhani]TDG37140.1 OmpA family protein [Pedobacter changchengzhani]
MNYSTLKKSLALSLVALTGVASLAVAQDMPAMTSSAKTFGGRAQYRTWSIGVNGGVLAPIVAIGGTNDFNRWDVNLGYGLNIRKQLGHSFALELNGLRGKVSGSNDMSIQGAASTDKSFETQLQYAADLRAVVNVGSIDFLRRENSVGFFVTVGGGYMAYAPKLTNAANVTTDFKGTGGGNPDGGSAIVKSGNRSDYLKTFYIPVGAGVKFKVSERVNFNLGYTMNFMDDDNLDGVYGKTSSNDHFSYGYAGLEFSLGSSAKPSLEWTNPLATMYDELKDPSLRAELEALKKRVTSVEGAIEGLKKDTDGDGVADQFDKCPGTPAGTAVDGSGCPLPKMTEAAAAASSMTGMEAIRFDFNSSVLKTESYPTLDKLSSVLRENGGKVTLNGYASSEGTAAYNVKLSKDRANSVKTYLVNSGVNSSQVSTKGFGEANPIASNDTEEGRMQNRRVETARN